MFRKYSLTSATGNPAASPAGQLGKIDLAYGARYHAGCASPVAIAPAAPFAASGRAAGLALPASRRCILADRPGPAVGYLAVNRQPGSRSACRNRLDP